MFCAPDSFSGTEGVRSLFNVSPARTRYRGRPPVGSLFGFRGRRVPFSCFARPDSFSAVPRVSGPVFMFCAPGLIFGGTECVNSCFHLLHARTHFRRYRGRQVPFSCFASSESFSAIPSAPGHVLRARTRFRRLLGRLVSFSFFTLPDSFSAVMRASGHIFMFCAPGLVLGRT
jgi:hypothetical protein